jgi:hypothetical protein
VHGADDFEVLRGLEDVAAVFLVLHPAGTRRFRRVLLGRKRVPLQGEREWARVERVVEGEAALAAELDLDVYETATRGLRVSPAAIAAGGGSYVLASHDDHTHLRARLELPSLPGDLAGAFALREEVDLIVAVRDPTRPDRPGTRGRRRKARLPAPLVESFGGRAYAPAAPELLDHEGVELVLIGVDEAAEHAGAAIGEGG